METQERLRRIDPARLAAFQAELLRKEYSRGTAEGLHVRSIRPLRTMERRRGGSGSGLTWKARLTARYAPATVQRHAGGT